MTDDIDSIRAERDRLRTENQRYQDALVQHPFQNTRVTPAMLERERAEKKARIDAAMKAGLEREAAARAEREQAERAAGAARLADFEGRRHQAWLHAGGDEAGWRRAWPGIKEQWLVEESSVDPKERRIQEAAARLRTDPRYASF